MRKKKHLSIDEKRDWLAAIFRDTSGEFSQADKFKAMSEDTRLAMIQDEQAAPPADPGPDIALLQHLPPPCRPSPEP